MVQIESGPCPTTPAVTSETLTSSEASQQSSTTVDRATDTGMGTISATNAGMGTTSATDTGMGTTSATDTGMDTTSVDASKAQTFPITMLADTPTTELVTTIPKTTTSFNSSSSQSFTKYLQKSTASEMTRSKGTTTTKSVEDTFAKNYHTAFVTSIATGTVGASILLVLLLVTCICLYTALAKYRRRRKETTDHALPETLDNSLMYNDIYMELSREKSQEYSGTIGKMEKGEPPFGEEPDTSLRGNPPILNTRKDSRYVLRHTNAEPTSVPPLPPQPLELSSSSDYMVPGTILSNNSVDHTHWYPMNGGGNGKNLVAPYAVVVSSGNFVTFPVEKSKTVKTAENVAYNVLPVHL